MDESRRTTATAKEASCFHSQNPRHRSQHSARLAVSLFWLTAIGCASTVQRNDWSTYTGPGAKYFRQEEYKLPYIADPLEPTNRIIWSMNEFVLFDLVEPISTAWRFLVPQVVRSHLVNATENISYPVRLVNNLLQGNLHQANDETRRFAINSTVGVLGLFDPAAAWGIPPAPQDLGITFTRWGWTQSPYLVLPFVGPSSVRDAIGRAGDLFLDPPTYYFPASLVTRFIGGSEIITNAKRVVRTNYDVYEPVRFGWSASRWLKKMTFESVEGDGPASQTLGIGLFRVQDPWFPTRARRLSVRLPSTGSRLPYDAWIQKNFAPIVYIVPGMGAHREADDVIALAEVVYRAGFSVVTISSAMNFEFIERASTVPVPGFAPVDSQDVHVALDTISRDLTRRYPKRIGAQVFMGMSLGAFHGLYIAAHDNPSDDTLIDFDRYVLLDPPVSIRHAAERLDAYYNVPLTFPKAHRDEHVRAILRKAATEVGHELTGAGNSPPISEEEAQFLIGLSFRLILHDAIWCTQKRHNDGILKSKLDLLRRAPASAEIYGFSFLEYFHAFVLPSYAEQPERARTAQEMFKRMDARSLTDKLPADGKIRVFSNTNDFLLTPADRQWLIDALGASNVTLRPNGGHLGSLYEHQVQRDIMKTLADLQPVKHGPAKRH